MVRRRAEMKKAGIEAGSMRVLLDSVTGSAQKSACPCSGSAWTEGKDIEVIMPSAPIRIRPGEDGQLIVQLPYSPDHVAKIKTVASRRWHAKERHWTVPPGDGMLGKLLGLFPGKPSIRRLGLAPPLRIRIRHQQRIFRKVRAGFS
jgi:hypothetical protein